MLVQVIPEVTALLQLGRPFGLLTQLVWLVVDTSPPGRDGLVYTTTLPLAAGP